MGITFLRELLDNPEHMAVLSLCAFVALKGQALSEGFSALLRLPKSAESPALKDGEAAKNNGMQE